LWWNESKTWETYHIQQIIQYSIESKVNACRCVNLIRWCRWVWNFKWGFLKFDCFLLVIFISNQKLCLIIEQENDTCANFRVWMWVGVKHKRMYVGWCGNLIDWSWYLFWIRKFIQTVEKRLEKTNIINLIYSLISNESIYKNVPKWLIHLL